MRTQSSGPADAPDHLGFQTTCGRDVQVGRLALGSADRPARRVSLDIGHSAGSADGTWAALTPAEARQLAVALLWQAAAADRRAGAAVAGRVQVSYLGGESYAVAIRCTVQNMLRQAPDIVIELD